VRSSGSFVFECCVILLVTSAKVMMSAVVECYHVSMLMILACVNPVMVGCCHISMLMISACVNPVMARCCHVSSLVTSTEGRYNGSQRVLLIMLVVRGPMFWHRLGAGSD